MGRQWSHASTCTPPTMMCAIIGWLHKVHGFHPHRTHAPCPHPAYPAHAEAFHPTTLQAHAATPAGPAAPAGRTALCWAAALGRTNLIELLLAQAGLRCASFFYWLATIELVIINMD
jgi:hypothetical protein